MLSGTVRLVRLCFYCSCQTRLSVIFLPPIFQYDDPKDATLEAVLELLHELDEAEDVRPVLDSKFGLKDALRDVVRSSNSWR